LRAGNAAILQSLLAGVAVNALRGQSIACLETAIESDAAHCIPLLLPYGVEPGGPFPAKKQTPVHLAAKANAVQMLELLLAAGADPDARDRLGRTPLYLAALANRDASIRLLRRFGADLTLASNDGMTPLAIARDKNKRRAIAALTAP
jgi:hypothetical protein